MNIEHILLGILQVGIIGFCGVLLVDFCDRKLDEKNINKSLKKQ